MVQCPRCGFEIPRDEPEEQGPVVVQRAEFLNWYSFYPRKVGRGAAERAYRTARRKVDAQTLLDAVGVYTASVAATEARFILHPATWLNGEHWADESPTTFAVIPTSDPNPEHEGKPPHPSWLRHKDAVIREMGPSAFGAWLSQCPIVSYDPLVIKAESAFKRDWIATHYQFQLQRALGSFQLTL